MCSALPDPSPPEAGIWEDAVFTWDHKQNRRFLRPHTRRETSFVPVLYSRHML